MVRRGGGSGAPLPRSTVVSKKISYVLRHGAEKEGLKLDESGYLSCADLLAWQPLRSLKVTFPELRDIVSSNDKQRFQLVPIASASSNEPSNEPSDSDLTPNINRLSPFTPENPSKYLIRATQGHSLTVASASLLTPVLPSDPDFPSEVVHGTFPAAWKKIIASGGLSKMGRQHVHFTLSLALKSSASKHQGKSNGKGRDESAETGVEGAKKEAMSMREGYEVVEERVEERKVISGMRNSASVYVWVDVQRSIEEGDLKWWRSANGVILTEGDEKGFVQLKWIKRVEQSGKGVIWRGEEESRKLGTRLVNG